MENDHLTLVRSAAPRGGVVLLQEAFGVTPHLLSVAGRFADAGWSVAVPHLYHRSGAPTFSYDLAEGEGVDSREPAAEQTAAEAIGPHAVQLTEAGVMADVDEAVAALGQDGIPSKSVAVVGFCFGGSVALYVSTQRELGAAVAYYGAGIASAHFGVPAFTDVAENRTTPLLAFYGGQDRWIPRGDQDVLEGAIGRSTSPGLMVRYPAAGHGFNCDRRSSHDPVAAAAAWTRTLGWLTEHAALAGSAIGLKEV